MYTTLKRLQERDAATVHRETSPKSGQMTLTAFQD